MRTFTKLIVHCSYTPPDMDIGAKEIREWHTDPKKPGGPFDDIGYNHVIRRDGEIEQGRTLEVPGAHTYGHNADSIGVCLVGGMNPVTKKPDFNFTFAQMWSLLEYKDRVFSLFGPLDIWGHRDIDDRKACPCFDVRAFFEKIERSKKWKS